MTCDMMTANTQGGSQFLTILPFICIFKNINFCYVIHSPGAFTILKSLQGFDLMLIQISIICGGVFGNEARHFVGLPNVMLDPA